MSTVPPLRVRRLNQTPVRRDGDYVLYWMTSARRLEWNFALDRALEHARELRLPVVVLEALRAAYPWACRRFHAFVLDGMREHRAQAEAAGVAYHPYVEPSDGGGKGLVQALAERAAVVVTDDFPTFFLRRMQTALAPRLAVALEAVDGNALLPLAATPGPFSAAFHFRRFLQRNLGEHLLHLPGPEPLTEAGTRESAYPADIAARWPAASDALLALEPSALAELPVVARVGPTALRGGGSEARRRLERFLDEGLPRYAEERNHPDAHAASGLSPWLHWGHISVHEIFHAVASREGWSPARLGHGSSGKRQGWWGMSASGESFLDELVTWRELGYGFCHHVPEHDRYHSLPTWAQETLADHAADPREAVYTLEQFDGGFTHDPLWNAAQRELRETGVMQNYLRMLWGKKILAWSRHPTEALDIMIELNNRYALDGSDPNSYTGIFWVLGRFDRGWPERPVYGKIRSMSSASTRRKLRLDAYLQRWGAQPELGLRPDTP